MTLQGVEEVGQALGGGGQGSLHGALIPAPAPKDQKDLAARAAAGSGPGGIPSLGTVGQDRPETSTYTRGLKQTRWPAPVQRSVDFIQRTGGASGPVVPHMRPRPRSVSISQDPVSRAHPYPPGPLSRNSWEEPGGPEPPAPRDADAAQVRISNLYGTSTWGGASRAQAEVRGTRGTDDAVVTPQLGPFPCTRSRTVPGWSRTRSPC